jgi:hypothetical protein
MICPKCNFGNDDSALICKNCGEIIGQPISAKSKSSKLAKTSFILGILSLPLSIFTGVPAIICSIISLRKIRKSGGLLKGKSLSISGLAISLISTFVIFPIILIWSADTPPIPNDFTIDDIRSAPAEYNESSKILQSLGEAGYLEDPFEPNDPNKNAEDLMDVLHALGISDPDKLGEYLKAIDPNRPRNPRDIIADGNQQEIRELILSNSDQIKDSWIKAEECREIIKQLNSYPEIADLSEPIFDVQLPYVNNLSSLERIYEAYIFLQIELGNSEDAVEKLIEIDSLARKLILNSRALDPKMTYISMLGYNIRAANYIANHPKANRQSIEILRKHFELLTEEEISFRNTFICNYLMVRNTLDNQLKEVIKSRPILIKRNSTLRIYKNLIDKLISYDSHKIYDENNLLKVWPAFYPRSLPNVDIYGGPYPWACKQYKYYNPAGALFVGEMASDFFRCIDLKDRLKVEDIFLQVILNQRLGIKNVPEIQTFIDDACFIDIENKKILHPGLDGTRGTNDDISLPIEPNVLNLVKKP